jgi:membrane-bound lytic murein transglycosylase D
MSFLSASSLTGSTLLIILGMSSCATKAPENKAIHSLLEADVGIVDDSFVAKAMTEAEKHPTGSQEQLKNELKRKVRWWIHYYTVRDRERFERNLGRGENYRPLVQQILWQEKLPPELYYLALIESGYVMHATSSTAAVGIWQFMKPTAITYGLEVDSFWDERQHPVAATYAAAHYLTSLHQKFNSWYMAIAAYNAGQGRIARAARVGRSNDFWFLAEHGFIPHETMDYIPKFLAAATIGENLKKFGFGSPTQSLSWPEFVPVFLKPGIKLKQLAKQSSLKESEILRFNPHLEKALARNSLKPIRIWVPKELAVRFVSHKVSLASRDSR